MRKYDKPFLPFSISLRLIGVKTMVFCLHKQHTQAKIGPTLYAQE